MVFCFRKYSILVIEADFRTYDMESIAETNGVITVSIANGFGTKHNHDVRDALEDTPHDNPLGQLEINPATALKSMEQPSKPSKKIKKGIYISYSPDAGFKERAFISDLVRQLKENNMAEDIWFDKDENCIDSPIWFSLRMDATEKCQAAIIILSDQYFMCPVSVYEARTLFERQIQSNTVKTFSILYSELVETEIPKHYSSMLTEMVDLTSPCHTKLSVAEKTSVVLASIMENLEKFAVINTPLKSLDDVEPLFNGEYKEKVSLHLHIEGNCGGGARK